MTDASNIITAATLQVFLAYARDAGNWSGEPIIGTKGNVTQPHTARAERGHITALKRAGLIEGLDYGDVTTMMFTATGLALARSHGINCRCWPAAPGADVE